MSYGEGVYVSCGRADCNPQRTVCCELFAARACAEARPHLALSGCVMLVTAQRQVVRAPPRRWHTTSRSAPACDPPVCPPRSRPRHSKLSIRVDEHRKGGERIPLA